MLTFERARLVIVIGGAGQYIGARVVADEVVVVALAFIGIKRHLQSTDQVTGVPALVTHQLRIRRFRRAARPVMPTALPCVVHPLAGRRSALEITDTGSA